MPFPDFTPAEDCVSCGLCLPHCPTYREYPVEMASPRGRIALMKGLASGRLEPGPALEEHLSLCLACRACETACPSSVQFGSLMESARAVMHERRLPASRFGDWFLKRIFPRQPRLAALAAAMKLYQATGLQWLVRHTPIGRVLPERLAELEAMMPVVSGWSDLAGMEADYAPIGPERGRVGFLSGCVMQLTMAETNRATVDVLRCNGFRVLVPRSQKCCGALHLHQGYLAEAKELAKANVAAFEGLDALITNAAGCGSALKDYGKLLEDEPVWAERAAALAARVRDVQEFLVERIPSTPGHPIRRRVVYDDPCHLLHGQRIRSQPRQLLEAIPGLELVEAREADWCCGSAGIYNVTHTEMSKAILRRKMEDLLSTRPDIIASANPGCIFQLRYGVRLAGAHVPVVHVMDLLAGAYLGRDEFSEGAEAPKR